MVSKPLRHSLIGVRGLREANELRCCCCLSPGRPIGRLMVQQLLENCLFLGREGGIRFASSAAWPYKVGVVMHLSPHWNASYSTALEVGVVGLVGRDWSRPLW